MTSEKRDLRSWKTLIQGVLATLVMLIGLAILLDWVIMPLYTKRGKECELPDVTEKSIEEARRILESKGLRVVIEPKRKYHPLLPSGSVISQNPLPLSRVKKGRRVYLTLSAGHKKIAVPRVIGLSERDAEFTLEQAGFRVGEVYYDFSAFYPEGVVFAQGVMPGDSLLENEVVDITVSIGPMPDRFVVPNVTGRSLQTARKMILQAGLRVGEIIIKTDDRYLPDTVLRQDPSPGQTVHQGSVVALVVSRPKQEAEEDE